MIPFFLVIAQIEDFEILRIRNVIYGNPCPFFTTRGMVRLCDSPMSSFYPGTNMHGVAEGSLIVGIYKGHLGADCTLLLRIRRIIV